jgi:chorismate mutase/prephenate dehydratase
VTWFFREVMSACLSLEQPLGIAFLGPLGTFSESAATKHFGHAARLMPQISIDDVFREVEACHADYAVVPIENSTEGAIGRTLDLLLTTPLKICGEVVCCASTSTCCRTRLRWARSRRSIRTPSRWRNATSG